MTNFKAQKAWENFMKKGHLLKERYKKDCPPYLPCLTATGDKYFYTKERVEDLNGFLSV